MNTTNIVTICKQN